MEYIEILRLLCNIKKMGWTGEGGNGGGILQSEKGNILLKD